MRGIGLFADRLITLTAQDIDNLNRDSHIAYLKALYECQSFILVDSSHTPTLNKKTFIQNFGYKDDFYLSFLSNQDSISDEYLQARKDLYHSYQLIKQEQAKILESQISDIDSHSINTHKGNRMSSNNLILESKDKNNIIIFLDDSHSLSNLIHLHNNKIDIFTKDKTYLDIQELESLLQEYINTNNTDSNNTHIKQNAAITLESLNSPTTQIFFYSHLLTGSPELPNNPLFFGELDKDKTIKQETPSYHFSPKDEAYNLGTLTIFLNSYTLTLLNYSLLNSTLNIKLTLTNKESQEKQQQAKVKTNQQTQLEQLKPLSTAFLHPILEDNEIKCPHNGVVKLKANRGKPFTSKGIPMVLESDLLNAQILGCANNIAGVPTPCTSVAVILPSARGLKKFNDDYPIMQDLVASGCLTDKGFPLTCTPKENTFRINSPNPTKANTQSKEALASSISLSKPILRLHYKIHSHQKDNLPIYRIKCNDSIIESHNDTPLDSLSIDIAKDTKELSDTSNLSSSLQDILSSLYTSLKETYTKGYKYHYLSLQLDSNALILILLIPQTIPKVFKEVYKNYEYKDYGIGKYHYLYNYCTHTMLDIQDYTQLGLAHNPSNATILTLHTPYKTQKLEIALASGLDSVIESDREQTQQIIDSLLTLQVVNGGYKESVNV